MAYNIQKSDGSPLVSVQDSTQDSTSSSLILVGRNAVNFGLSINQNFIDLLQNFANTSAPPNALQGQLWYDTVNNDLKVYNGSKWISISTGIDGSSGLIDTQVGPNNTFVTIVISQWQIITVVSGEAIPRSNCPDSIIFNDISYAFASRFPNGIFAGLNIATDPSNAVDYWIQGKATKANVLVNARTVYINGAMIGNFSFDGSKNVNVTVKDSNVYVNNTNVTVKGTWTKVLVSDGGRVIAGNNLTAGDIVTALGYTPFAGSNANVNAIGNTVVARDQNANFASNIIVVNNLVANYTVQADIMAATQFVGTATEALTLKQQPTIYVEGDIYGNVKLVGNANVVLSTNLLTTGVQAGNYNLVNVDTKGRVTNGGYYDFVPFGMICLFPAGSEPAGYTECNGQAVADATSGLSAVTPNLVAESHRISVGSGMVLKYYMKYIVAPPISFAANIAAGIPSVPSDVTTVIVDNTPPVTTPMVVTDLTDTQVMVESIPAPPPIEPGFIPLIEPLPAAEPLPEPQYEPPSFADVIYYDAVALIMSLGDYNGVMFSKNDIWKNLRSLTVDDIENNLSARAKQNLPAAIGKYMVPFSLLKQQITALGCPPNTSFSPLLQDNVMSNTTSMFTQKLQSANIPVNSATLFGCHYFASADAMIAIMKSNSLANVKSTLLQNGYYTTVTSALSFYTRDEFLWLITAIITVAEQEIQYRNSQNQNVIVCGSQTASGNVIVDTPLDGGFRIGNSDFVDMHGGYFIQYERGLIQLDTDDAKILPAVKQGSIGTVSFELWDAGAAALAGVMQSDNRWDQAGQAHLCINRLGASISGAINYPGKTGFDIATAKDAFTGLSAALYGANANATASEKWGELFININDLKEVLAIGYKPQFIDALAGLFSFKLSYQQLERVYELREQIWTNGPELDQIQNAISNAVESVPSSSLASEVVKKPFGANACGYLTTSELQGFYTPNTGNRLSTSPAPSPIVLLERLVLNLKKPIPTLLNSINTLIQSQANAVTGGNTITTGAQLTTKLVTSKFVSNEISSVSSIVKKITQDNPEWNWWSFYKK